MSPGFRRRGALLPRPPPGCLAAGWSVGRFRILQGGPGVTTPRTGSTTLDTSSRRAPRTPSSMGATAPPGRLLFSPRVKTVKPPWQTGTRPTWPTPRGSPKLPLLRCFAREVIREGGACKKQPMASSLCCPKTRVLGKA